MKRTKQIRLVLLGGLSAGALSSCSGNRDEEPRVTTTSVYSNDYFIQGAGYYHAPFHAFYPRPYNFFEPTTKQYYYGGQWHPDAHRSIVNISAPTADAASAAENARAVIQRSGFGSTSRSHHIWS